MPTGQDLVNGALTTLGILDPSGTPSVSDSNDSLAELNNMWPAWGIDEGLINQVVPVRFPLVANVGLYTLGNPGTSDSGGLPSFNTTPPARIYKAYLCKATAGAIATDSLGDAGTGYAANDTGVILGANGSLATYAINTVSASGAVETYTISAAGTGYIAGNGYSTQTGGAQPGAGTGFTLNILSVTTGGESRTELEVVPATRYYAHRDLQASAYTPDEVYPDYLPDVDGYVRVYVFPIPVVATAAMLELQQAVNFIQWSLTGSQFLPPAYQDAINYVLAFRLIPRFGAVVDPNIAQLVTSEALKAENRIREMNRMNRMLPPGAEATPQAPQAQK